MLYTKLPKTRYNTTTYPNLEARADGAPIPIAYGDLHGIIPICIDTTAFTFKVAGHAIHSIDAVKTELATLTLTSDYTVDLVNAQFTLCSTPYLAANTTYYFVLSADYAVSGSDYVSFKKTNAASYTDGNAFTINGADAWTSDPTVDLYFRVYGRTTLSGQTQRMVDTTIYGRGAGLALKDNAARTRIAHSFKTGATGFFLTNVTLWTTNKGTPSGKIRITILSAYTPAEVQVGAQSIECDIENDSNFKCYHVYFPLQSDATSFICDIEGAEKLAATIVDGADMIEDLITNRLSKPSSLLDATALANFKAKRTQAIKAYIDRDMTFGDIVGKLESTLLFKFVPLQNGTYATVVYEAGEPAGTSHFFDEHFVSFSMRRDFSAVKNIIKIKYDEDPGNQEFKVATAESYATKFVYGIEDTLEVETYLRSTVNAASLATSYSGLYDTPPLEITFEIRGYGLNLIPGQDKVKITRTRAAYAGGTLSAVLFRITKLTKKPASATTEITAILDTDTY
jgi:hypothetical protein